MGQQKEFKFTHAYPHSVSKVLRNIMILTCVRALTYPPLLPFFFFYDNCDSTLLASQEMSEFVHVKVFLDEDFSSTEKFTVNKSWSLIVSSSFTITVCLTFSSLPFSPSHSQALGNLYFIHHSIDDCQIWDFHSNSFVPVEGQDIQAGNIENVPIKEKDKFPKDFFPEVNTIFAIHDLKSNWRKDGD